MDLTHVKAQDRDVYNAIIGEQERQRNGLELIPSENYVSKAVLEAMGSVLTNKYCEGYPGARYYGGQEFTDNVENIARDRAKELFNCKFANVQPHSGAPANIATYFALLEPGDTIMGMDLSHGGHLTHGHPVTHIAKIFNFVRYEMKDVTTGEIDYDAMLAVAKKEKPKMILAGFSAYSRELDYARFVSIAREVGAFAVADMAHIAGLIAGGAARNPFDDGFDVILTTTHKTLRGPRGGMILTRDDADIAKKIDKSVFPGFQGGPHMASIAGKAVCFAEALHPSFTVYAAQIVKNAQAMADVFSANDVAMLAGGTDNHLILVDVQKSFDINGQVAEDALDAAGITLNKNMIANDPNPPMKPSGIRLGTPAITTRGMGEEESSKVAKLMISVLKNPSDNATIKKVRADVEKLCDQFPIPDSFI